MSGSWPMVRCRRFDALKPWLPNCRRQRALGLPNTRMLNLFSGSR